MKCPGPARPGDPESKIIDFGALFTGRWLLGSGMVGGGAGGHLKTYISLSVLGSEYFFRVFPIQIAQLAFLGSKRTQLCTIYIYVYIFFSNSDHYKYRYMYISHNS